MILTREAFDDVVERCKAFPFHSLNSDISQTYDETVAAQRELLRYAAACGAKGVVEAYTTAYFRSLPGWLEQFDADCDELFATLKAQEGRR